MDRTTEYYVEDPNGELPESAPLRAKLRRAALLPFEPTLPEDVELVGAINDAVNFDRSFVEDGR